jgi:hypothetical protein
MGLAAGQEADTSGESAVSLAPELSLRLMERYDSNVMLQDEGAQAGYESFVTSVLPVLGGKLSATGETPYHVSLKYAPDFTFYHDLSRESYLRHIGLLDFDVSHGQLSVNGNVAAKYTDGTTDPPTWGTAAAPGAVPALGATEVRGRRRNMYFASQFTARQDLGKAFVRGVFDARIWDFMTEDQFPPELPNPTQEIIQNYYDRDDINGGVDLGVKLDPKLEIYAGYRLGHQDQEYRALPGYPLPSPYSNNSYSYANLYHRFPIGLKTTPSEWFRLAGEIGPSLHFFDASTIQPGTHTQQNYLYFLVRGEVQLATNTLFTVVSGQHLLPAAAGNGLFQNLTFTAAIKQRFSDRVNAAVSFDITDYDFDAEFTRWDRVYMPGAKLEYAFSKHFSAGLAYSYAWAVSLIPNTSNREYTRHLVGLSVSATY